MTPLRCVIDTNVAVVANRQATDEDAACVAACARALDEVVRLGHVFVDNEGAIVREYRKNIPLSGQPRPGSAFFKWLLTHEWSGTRVTRVPLTRKASDPDDFEELPQPEPSVRLDPPDRKFLAVAAAHPERPAVLQALDSKWLDWRDALRQVGISIHFLCPEEIERIARGNSGR